MANHNLPPRRRVWHLRLPRGWRLYLADCLMKPRVPKSKKEHKEHRARNRASRHKEAMYRDAEGRCQMCRAELPQRRMQLHHVLPVSRYPELSGRRDNLMLLCPDCHEEIHQNPFLNARLIVETACTLGIDLSERYKNEE